MKKNRINLKKHAVKLRASAILESHWCKMNHTQSEAIVGVEAGFSPNFLQDFFPGLRL